MVALTRVGGLKKFLTDDFEFQSFMPGAIKFLKAKLAFSES